MINYYRVLIITLFLFLLPVSVNAATVNAASCSVTDINTAIGTASTGDIVKVPACTVNWDTSSVKVTLNKGIHLQGDGIGRTNITITNAQANYYQGIEATSHNDWRISGFSFKTDNPSFSAIRAAGTNTRIDHCRFTGFKWALIIWNVTLIDSNEFYGGGIDREYGGGEAAWAGDTNLGGADFVFIENNKFSNLGALTKVTRFLLTYSGAKFVFRYNNIFSENIGAASYLQGMNNIIDAHGYCHATSANAGRGVRAYEIYNNTQTKTDSGSGMNTAFQLRSGTGVIYNNRVLPDASYSSGAGILMYDWRAQNWNSTGGNQCYTVSPNTEGKYYCLSNIYRVQTTSTVHTSLQSGATVIKGKTSGATATTAGFYGGSPGYIIFHSITNGPFLKGEELQTGCPGACTTVNIAATDSELYSGEGYPCADQVGRGKNQAKEPIYIWDNVDTGGNPSSSAALNMVPGYITKGIDYINGVKPEYTPYPYPHPLTYPHLKAPMNLSVSKIN